MSQLVDLLLSSVTPAILFVYLERRSGGVISGEGDSWLALTQFITSSLLTAGFVE